MGKATNPRKRGRAGPSAPRVIGANDNAAGFANDNERLIVNGVQLTAKQTARFKTAAEQQASRDFQTRVMGRDAMARLEAEILGVANENRRKTDEEEFLALELARGAVIETSDRQETRGRKRIATRDGLETLLTAKSITHVQHAAGMRYRTDYEALDPEKGLTPPSIDQSRIIVRGGDGYALKRREIEERVRDLEALIQEEDRTFRGALGRTDVERVGRAVWALREVAGKGSNIRDLATGGAVRDRMSASLIVALDCSAIAYGLE